jgi:RNA polymerase sigma-70 factor (ECF subfamily)
MGVTVLPAPALLENGARVDEAEAFQAFYADLFPQIAGYCLMLTSDPGAADDLAQETLTEVYARWRRLREPRPYAFRVARNLARGQAGRRIREVATWSALVEHAVPGTSPDPTLWDAVARLSPEHRDVVLLHYQCDLPLSEVAHIIRRPVGTVKRRLHEARTHLAATLGDRS